MDATQQGCQPKYNYLEPEPEPEPDRSLALLAVWLLCTPSQAVEKASASSLLYFAVCVYV